MAKGKKKGSKRGASRKGSKKSKGSRSRKGMPAWAKLSLVLLGGYAVGSIAESAGLLGTKGTVSGPAVGIALAGGFQTGFRRLPSAPVVAAALSAQGFRTVSKTETYAKVESAASDIAAKFLKSGGKSTAVAALTPDRPSSSQASDAAAYASTAKDLASTLNALNGVG